MDTDTAVIEFVTIAHKRKTLYSAYIHVPFDGYPYLLGVTLGSFLDGMKLVLLSMDKENSGNRITDGVRSLITQISTLLSKSPENIGDASVYGERELHDRYDYTYTITLNEDDGTISIGVKSDLDLYKPFEKKEVEEIFKEREQKFKGPPYEYNAIPSDFVSAFRCLSSTLYKPILPSKKRKGKELREDKMKVARMFFDTIQQGKLLDNRDDKTKWIKDNRDTLVAMLDEICYR